jgi:hypothetical protein
MGQKYIVRPKRRRSARSYLNETIRVNAAPPPPTQFVPSVTPTVTSSPLPPSSTPTPTVTPTVTKTPSITPTPTPSAAYCYLANVYGCAMFNNQPVCGQSLRQEYILNNTSDFIVGQFYPDTVNNVVYRPISRVATTANYILVDNTTSFSTCAGACYIVEPSPTPTVSKTPTVTPSITSTISVTPSVTPSITSTISVTPSITVSPSVTPTITKTPSVTPSITSTISVTPSITVSPSVTPSITLSVTPTPSFTPTITVTPSITLSVTPTPSFTPTITVTPTITKTPSSTPSPSLCVLQVGDAYGGGFIAYVNGCHGIIVDLSVLPITGTWGTQGTNLGTVSTLLSGGYNTDLIYSANSGDPNNIATKVKGLSSGGYTDWVIPTSADMCEIALNNGILGIFNTQYWTSYEGYVEPINGAFYMSMASNCPTYQGAKTDTHRFIPVRYF